MNSVYKLCFDDRISFTTNIYLKVEISTTLHFQNLTALSLKNNEFFAQFTTICCKMGWETNPGSWDPTTTGCMHLELLEASP